MRCMNWLRRKALAEYFGPLHFLKTWSSAFSSAIAREMLTATLVNQLTIFFFLFSFLLSWLFFEWVI